MHTQYNNTHKITTTIHTTKSTTITHNPTTVAEKQREREREREREKAIFINLTIFSILKIRNDARFRKLYS
jgi:hypothetical protein